MRPRHLPRLWLMTDERLGEALWTALAALPRGSGVVFRHYATEPGKRRRMFAKVARIARSRRLVLVRAGADVMRDEVGTHNRTPRTRGLKTRAVHTQADWVASGRPPADLVFVSPVFATRSHPAARPLGVVRLGLLIRGLRARGVPVVALGGMTAARFRRLRGLGVHGWAAIDAWGATGPQA